MITHWMNGGAMQFYCRGRPPFVPTTAHLLKALREMLWLKGQFTLNSKIHACGAIYLSRLLWCELLSFQQSSL